MSIITRVWPRRPGRNRDMALSPFSRASLKIDDTYCLALLQPLLNGYPYIPFTGAAIRPFCLVHMLNDIIANGRQSIIEFGPGLSTIIIGRLIRKNALSATLLSVEHDAGWIKLLREILRKEGLDEIITVLHAPMVANDSAYSDWYDTDQVNAHIGEKKFDMVIIDGPPAWQSGREKARFPALPFIKNKLCKKFSVYLDDANRAGEKAVIGQWEKEHDMHFTITGDTLAWYCTPGSFFTEPFSF